ncbi:MAG: hypothetical protein WBM13_05760 [Bacteroidia bacterium]
MKRLMYFRPFFENEQPQVEIKPAQNAAPLCRDISSNTVGFEYYGEESLDPYTLEINPSKGIYQLITPSGFTMLGNTSENPPNKLLKYENGKLYDWICSMLHDTDFFYSNLIR